MPNWLATNGKQTIQSYKNKVPHHQMGDFYTLDR